MELLVPLQPSIVPIANLSLVHTVMQQEDGGQNAAQKKCAVLKRNVRVRKKKCASLCEKCAQKEEMRAFTKEMCRSLNVLHHRLVIG